MGLHLCSGALNQAALARGRATAASAAWLGVAVAFVAWLAVPLVGDELLRAELGYMGAAAVLAGLLGALYRGGGGAAGQPAPAAAAMSE
jgi:hypothetical protein